MGTQDTQNVYNGNFFPQHIAAKTGENNINPLNYNKENAHYHNLFDTFLYVK